MVKTSSHHPAEGLVLPNCRGQYLIGRELGNGAQGSVHAMTDNTGREVLEWAVKLAKHPIKKAAIKKKKSIEEINVGMLFGEYHLYKSHFRIMREEGGGNGGNALMIPRIPLAGTNGIDVPDYGDIKNEQTGQPGKEKRWDRLLLVLLLRGADFLLCVAKNRPRRFLQVVIPFLTSNHLSPLAYLFEYQNPPQNTDS